MEFRTWPFPVSKMISFLQKDQPCVNTISLLHIKVHAIRILYTFATRQASKNAGKLYILDFGNV